MITIVFFQLSAIMGRTKLLGNFIDSKHFRWNKIC